MEQKSDYLEWYDKVAEFIVNDIQGFYEKMYGVEGGVINVGNSTRINPCPMCGHKDSCTITNNMVHCFSGDCSWKGTHINAYIKYVKDKLGKSVSFAIKQLEDYTGIKQEKYMSQEEREAYVKKIKRSEIMSFAQDFYHEQLLTLEKTYAFAGKEYTPLNYFMEIRKHRLDIIKKYKVGFAFNYLELRKSLLSLGYTPEEIKEAKIWIPEGLFTFFYKHPITGDLLRINTKNPFKICFPEEKEPIKGFSINDKCLLFSDEFDFNQDIVIVEGENDFLTIIETGFKNVCCIGGSLDVREYKILEEKLGQNTSVYAFFDNDKAGEKYLSKTNEFFADRNVYKISISNTYNDPDEYYTENDCAEPIKSLMESAEKLVTDKYKIYCRGRNWSIATRDKRIDFRLKDKDSKGSIIGSLSFTRNGVLADRQEEIALTKCKAVMRPLNFELLDRIQEYFNSEIDKKRTEDLVYIFKFSSKKSEILKTLAERFLKTENQDEFVNNLKITISKFGYDSDLFDNIMKEANDIQNRKISPADVSHFPKMKTCQYFNVRNNDAYFYFNYVKEDGDTVRKLPYLLRNDGVLIRLDLLKRKDKQCLLLVDNKYELPYEISEAVLDLNECSLTQEWVEKLLKNEITDEQINPSLLIRELERYIRRFYYSDDKNCYKVLALYIYTTYFYELFSQMPYLFLNGEKGSGKSVLDTIIYMFAFDAKMAIDISEASLFRMAGIDGGTIILDEMENLTSRSKTQDSTMASILKGGYAKAGSVYRVNNEKGSAVERFDIYGPKIISNIFGIDDVIEDRCIQISTYRIKLTKETKLEDPKYYLQERMDEVRSLTSRMALSALKEFKTVHDIYNDSLFETNNARLSQILTPILAIAKWVDLEETKGASYGKEITNKNEDGELMGEYETALVDYFNTTLAGSKDAVEQNTPEGIIKYSLREIAKEFAGLTPERDKEFTVPHYHKYEEPMVYNKEEGYFELNLIHLKCFIEEANPGDTVYLNIVRKWLKTVHKIKQSNIRRRRITVTNEDLTREFKGNAKPKVQWYRFYINDFVDTSKEFLEGKENKENKKDKKGKLF